MYNQVDLETGIQWNVKYVRNAAQNVHYYFNMGVEIINLLADQACFLKSFPVMIKSSKHEIRDLCYYLALSPRF